MLCSDSKTKKLSEDAIRRAKHVILENERVLRSAEAMKNNDFEYLGELMVASHNSLRLVADIQRSITAVYLKYSLARVLTGTISK